MKQQINPANHPYMKTLQDKLTPAKQKLECLEKRIVFIQEGDMITGTPYQKNEAMILLIETREKIEAIKRIIKEKEAYFLKFMAQYIEDMDEIDSNFDNVVARARKQAETDEALAEFLGKIFWENLNKNTESKIYFYKQIKKRLT